MDSEMPSIAIGLDHFGLASKVGITVLRVPVSKLSLKVALELDPVGWVDISRWSQVGRHTGFLGSPWNGAGNGADVRLPVIGLIDHLDLTRQVFAPGQR